LWDGLFLDPAQIAEVLAQVKRKTSARYLYPLLVTAAHTGARRSELFRARVEDVDFDANLILLREKKRNRDRETFRTAGGVSHGKRKKAGPHGYGPARWVPARSPFR
jgi:integrase